MSQEDLEELQRAIELKLKLGKLDSLLLFVPTLLGLAFSLLQYGLGLIKQPIDVLFIAPALLLGIGAPIYIGYYRGGVKLDSITERARGWIYLIVGLSVYLLPPIVGLLDAWLPNSYWLVRLFSFLTMFTVGYISSSIGEGILSLTDKKPSRKDRNIFSATGFAASLLASTFIVAVDHLRSMAQGKAALLTAFEYVATWIMLLHLALVLELSARGTITEGLRSPMAAAKSTLTVLGSIPLLLAVTSLESVSTFFPDSSKIFTVLALLLLGVYVILTVILVRKEIRRSSIARHSSKPVR